MDASERTAKKIAEAHRLRGVSATATLQMAFDLIRVTRDLHEAASHADA